MKLLITAIALVLLLPACTVVPVAQSFPELPAILQRPCPDLEIIDTDTVTLSELLYKMETNYSKRHECAALTESLQKWYVDQRQIFNEANEK